LCTGRVVIRFILLILVIAGGLVFLGAKTEVLNSVHELASDMAYDRDFEVSGLNVLNSYELIELLPAEKNSLWWRLNTKTLQGRLLAHPLVESAQVQPCSFFQFSCFSLSLVERSPDFILLSDQSASIIGSDGGYIAPLPAFQNLHSFVEMIDQTFPEAVLLKGLFQDKSSPDIARARFLNIKKSIDTIEEETSYRVHSLELRDRGEALLKLRGLPFMIVFTLEGEDAGRAREESRRFRKVLSELEGKFHLVKKVDLAFDELAVVSFKE